MDITYFTYVIWEKDIALKIIGYVTEAYDLLHVEHSLTIWGEWRFELQLSFH